MKNKRTCESYTTLSILLISSLFIATVLPGRATGKIEPVGTPIEAVQFDAVIELNRYVPRSDRHDYTIMFARYWVASDYYTAALVWAEPQSSDLYFALYPPGLSVTGNTQSFEVYHGLYPKHSHTYERPLGERGVLRHKLGGYPIGNIRFADREALAERIYAHDLSNLKDANQLSEGMPDPPIQSVDRDESRDVARLKMLSNGENIASMKLFNAEQRLLKDISYEYESRGDRSFLRKQTVFLPERPMIVGFNSEGMKVTLDGKEFRYKDLEVTHHAGGRTCTIEYEQVSLGDKEVTLPVHVTVRNGKDGNVLRSVRMMNFRQVDLDVDDAKEAARKFSAVSADRSQYEQLHKKYWKKTTLEIEKADIETIEQLWSRFDKAATTADNIGEKLKCLNVLIQLDSILGDHNELERHYKSYLSTLADNKLDWMTLVGGYGVIEKLMYAERHAVAKILLNVWIHTLLDMHENDEILLFARQQLAKKRLWTTAVLLELFSNKEHYNIEARFEAQVLRCAALAELNKLPRADDIAKKGRIAEVQSDWITPIGKKNLDKMLAESTNRAKNFFASVADPTESQKVLNTQLTKIEQEIRQEKKQRSD